MSAETETEFARNQAADWLEDAAANAATGHDENGGPMALPETLDELAEYLRRLALRIREGT